MNVEDRTGQVWEDKGGGRRTVYLIIGLVRQGVPSASTWHKGLVLCSDDPDYPPGSIEHQLIEQLRPWEKEPTLARLA